MLSANTDEASILHGLQVGYYHNRFKPLKIKNKGRRKPYTSLARPERDVRALNFQRPSFQSLLTQHLVREHQIPLQRSP